MPESVHGIERTLSAEIQRFAFQRCHYLAVSRCLAQECLETPQTIMSDFDLRDGRLGAVVGRWCYLGGPMERAFLIVARTHSTQPDGAPVELNTLIEYEPHSAAAIRL